MRFFTRFPALTGAALLPALSAYSQEAKPARTVDFMREVKPLIEGACINCHGPNTTEKNGDYLMHTKEAAFKGGESYENEVIKPGDADDSPVYWMTTEPEDGDLMPPKHPLSKHQQEILKVWIDTGAEWPDGVTLQKTSRVTFQSIRPLIIRGGPFKPSELETLRLWAEQGADWPEGVKIAGSGDGPADDLNLVKKIRELIVASSKEKSQGDMKNYESTIPKTGVKFEMVAIPGGEFTMGSPASEANRNADEGPQRKLKISPFWMGKFEVTWDMYEPFMITSVPRNKDGSPQKIDPSAEPVDVVSAPTTPYVEMSFGMGTQGYPAISMTQHAALKFCEWLSAQTGQYYRLPTEAEWEYACRAGTTGPFHCDESELDQYAVLDPTATRTGYEKVGTKKPNPWGLYDMHGNVLEWCLDQYNPNGYPEGEAENPLVKPKTLYPRVARGGSWYDPAEFLRSAARTGSEASWKQQDPQLPKSIWYHTDAQWLGFRLVRPLEVPAAEEMFDIWNQGLRDEG